MPTNQAPKPTSMNSEILVNLTGTPTARALSWLPPTAKIQLPYLVRSSTQVASAANTSHHTTVIFTWTSPRWKEEEKTLLAWSKPSMSLMSSVATLPVTSLVTARLTPWRPRKVPRVTRKLGSPVRTIIQPLNAPMARDSTSATSTPTQTFMVSWKLIMAAVSAELITATPADRSNSPPIISSATGSAMMPMVDAW